MTLLVLAALLWLGIHIGVAGTGLRGLVVALLGATGFQIAFSVASVVSIVLLVMAYNAAPGALLWVAPDWLRWLLVLAMLPAAILFVGSVALPNPTAAGGERAMDGEPRGMTRITRHPMLWSFSVWAAVHVIGNGDTASLVFFGTFLITSLAGMPSIDAKLARRDGVRWARVASATSIVPFAAIAAGRNRLALSELGLIVPLTGVLLWAVLLFGHRYVIGVSPLPIA